MKFSEAVEFMFAKGKARRPLFRNRYVTYDKEIALFVDDENRTWVPRPEDAVAEDWEFIQ